MYKRNSGGWMKHVDFIILDILCLQVALMLAHACSGYGWDIYTPILYRNVAMFLGLADLMLLICRETMKGVIRRGHFREFTMTVKQAVFIEGIALLYLFLLQEGQNYSRPVLLLMPVCYSVVAYAVRELWKWHLQKKKTSDEGKSALLIAASEDVVERVVKTIKENNYAQYIVAGVSLIGGGKYSVGEKIDGVPVVAEEAGIPHYVCQDWIDEVLVVTSDEVPYPGKLLSQLMETGVTVHLSLAKVMSEPGKKQFVEKIGPYTVLTTSINYASSFQLFLKRAMDIMGGLVGCTITVLLLPFVGTAIYLASPGPIFFAQERVGKNGKRFKMYKFRSMYMDAEARKAELMKDNRLGDGKMFKLDFDPRVRLKKKSTVILTPHPAELARLCGVTVGEVMSDRLGSAYRLSEKYGVTVLAKSADTFAVDGGKVYLCTEGTTALAKGGSGDMLAGIVSSYVAQGCNALDAAALGSFTLGSTALLAGYKRSERGIIARDVIDALPRFLYDLENAD